LRSKAVVVCFSPTHPPPMRAICMLAKHVRWYLVGLHPTTAAQSRRGLHLSHVPPSTRARKQLVTDRKRKAVVFGRSVNKGGGSKQSFATSSLTPHGNRSKQSRILSRGSIGLQTLKSHVALLGLLTQFREPALPLARCLLRVRPSVACLPLSFFPSVRPLLSLLSLPCTCSLDLRLP
jgi:hypothetical protein